MAEAGREHRNGRAVLFLIDSDAEVGEFEGGAEHDADRAEATLGRVLLRGVPRGDAREHTRGDGALCLDDARRLQACGLGVRGRGQDEHALARCLCELERALQRTEPEIGAERHRIRFERGAGPEPGLAVRLLGRADVAALGVGDHEDAGGARLGDDPFERLVAGGAETLEEGDLRLNDSGAVPGGLDHTETELAGAVSRIVETPALEHPRVRVDADAEVPGAVEDRPELVAECQRFCLAHAFAARWMAYSCRLVTSKPVRTASSDATAALSSAMVVNSGMSAATAAARIS